MTRKNARRRNQRGYTLLEYCAGAALIAGIIWVSLSAMSQNLSGLLDAIGSWASRRTQDVQL